MPQVVETALRERGPKPSTQFDAQNLKINASRSVVQQIENLRYEG
jgi:hypothetical protein